jgi:hypothetical protein
MMCGILQVIADEERRSMTPNDLPRTLLATTAHILRPLVRILLRHGISYAAFSELAKRIYFEVAKSDFVLPGKKQTSSRISTMTGLSRKEVARLESIALEKMEPDASAINRAARVISGWVRDPLFHDTAGEPADLPFEGNDASFSVLVKKYSGDITARTIADELTRVDAISVSPAGHLHLNTRAYVARASDIDKLVILGTDVSNLIATIEHNLIHPESPLFQRKVAYNTIPMAELPQLQQQLFQIAQGSLESMDEVLAANAVEEKGTVDGVRYVRVGVGIYYFKEEQL